MESNGKTYEMQYLTDEEKAVIDAMRMGARADVHFFNSTEGVAKAHAEELAGLVEIEFRELKTESGVGFESYEFHIGKHTIYHFVDK